jgi:hypothetical protein
LDEDEPREPVVNMSANQKNRTESLKQSLKNSVKQPVRRLRKA